MGPAIHPKLAMAYCAGGGGGEGGAVSGAGRGGQGAKVDACDTLVKAHREGEDAGADDGGDDVGARSEGGSCEREAEVEEGG